MCYCDEETTRSLPTTSVPDAWQHLGARDRHEPVSKLWGGVRDRTSSWVGRKAGLNGFVGAAGMDGLLERPTDQGSELDSNRIRAPGSSWGASSQHVFRAGGRFPDFYGYSLIFFIQIRK